MWLSLDLIDQPLLILPHLEELIVLAEPINRAFAIRTESIGHVFFRPKALIERAVPACIRILVDQSLVEKLLKVSLNNLLMRMICRSDERIMRNVQTFPELLKLRSELVTVDLRIDSGLGRGLLDFLTMLVEPCEEKHVTSAEAPIARQHVCGDRRIRMPDMRDVIDVVDGSGDVERVRIAHKTYAG